MSQDRMMELDEIFNAALQADPQIVALTGGRIYSTCVEVPPTEDDNTPLPYIVITDDSLNNMESTKDGLWEGTADRVQASVLINGHSPSDVKHLRRLVRLAIGRYVASMEDQEPPYLQTLTNDGIAWDWTKPCYYDTLHYQCDMDAPTPEPEDETETVEPQNEE